MSKAAGRSIRICLTHQMSVAGSVIPGGEMAPIDIEKLYKVEII